MSIICIFAPSNLIFTNMSNVFLSNVMSPKDDQRVLRSIRSIMAKIEISMMLQNKRSNERHFQSEQELEEYCITHGLIYSPIKYPL